MFGAFTICTHAGQGCALTTRLLVPRAQHDQIAEMVAGMLQHVAVGDPGDTKTYMGPLISESSATRSTAWCSAPSPTAPASCAVVPGSIPDSSTAQRFWPMSTPTARSRRGGVRTGAGDDSPTTTKTTPCASPTTQVRAVRELLSADDDRALAIRSRIPHRTFSITAATTSPRRAVRRIQAVGIGRDGGRRTPRSSWRSRRTPRR